jgi:hypothetical protein
MRRAGRPSVAWPLPSLGARETTRYFEFGGQGRQNTICVIESGWLPCPPKKQKGLRFRRPFDWNRPGGVLLSHAVSRAVQSGLRGLTSVFGMGTGGTLSLWPPRSGFRGLPELAGGADRIRIAEY